MFGLPKERASKKIVAVVDVENGSAGVCIALIEAGKPALIISTERRFLPLEDRTPEAALSGTMMLVADACERALTQFESSSYKKIPINGLYVVLHAPWVTSETIRSVSKTKMEQRVTDEVIRTIARESLSKRSNAESSNMFETSVVRVELNGYTTAHPIGKSAHEIGVVTLASECEGDVHSALVSTLERIFPTQKPVMRSQTRAIISTISSIDPTITNYVIADVTSEAIRFTSVHANLSSNSATVAEGTRAILKRVTEDGIHEDIMSILRMIEREECTSDACDEVRNELARIEPDLLKVYGEAMGKIAVRRRLPNNLILFVQPDFAPWMARFFSRIDFTQFTVTTQPFAVRVFSTQDLKDMWVSEGKAIPDPGLALAVGLVNSENQSE